MKNWYYKIDDKVFGPITEEELQHGIKHGELTKETLIQDEEMDMWVKASSINGLIDVVREEEQTKRLPVFGTITEAFIVMKENMGILWKPLFLSGVLMVVLNMFFFDILKLFVVEPNTMKNMGSFAIMIWLQKIVYAIFFVIFTITTHRIILLGKDSVNAYGLSWSRREWIFVLYSIGIYIILLVLSFLMLPIVGMVASLGSSYFMIIMNLAMLAIMLLFSRLSMLIPAISVEKIDIDWSWTMSVSKNNGFRLLIVLSVVPFIFKYLLGFMVGISRELNILAEIITLFLLVFEIILLSLSFKYLTGFERDE